MKIKIIVSTMVAAGLVSGSAFAANQRSDIAYLRHAVKKAPVVYTKGAVHKSWFAQHVNVNGKLAVDAGVSNRTKVDPLTGHEGPNGLFSAGTTGMNSSSDISLGDSALSVDVIPSPWAMGHIEIVANDRKTTNTNATTNRFYSNSFVQLDEAYLTLGNLNQSPFYITAGRKYISFGNYGDPHPLVESLTEQLSKTNATTIELGYLQPKGFYANMYVYRGLLKRATATNLHANVNNFGTDLGYNWTSANNKNSFNVDLGWTHNMVDAEALYPVVSNNNGNTKAFRRMADATALGLSGNWGPFDAKVSYVAALRKFETADLAYQGTGAEPVAGMAEAGYAFNALGHHNHIMVSYQLSREGSALGIPKRRYTAGWTFNLYKQTNLSFVYDHDKDYSVVNGGTGTSSNAVLGRITVGFL